MNTKLLHKVALAILAEPTKFDMSLWTQPDQLSPCGTTACIAGWAVAIDKRFETLSALRDADGDTVDIPMDAEEILKLTADQASLLFYRSSWPSEYLREMQCSCSRMERAEISFWRIQHFIATNGKE